MTGTLSRAVGQPTVVVLEDGKALVLGGIDGGVDVYDSAANALTPTTSMNIGRINMGATRLLDGRVLVTGGSTSGGLTATTEIYDPVGKTWTLTDALLPYAAFAFGAVTLPDGRVLAIGGVGELSFLASTALYDPGTDRWTNGPSMAEVRALPEVVALAADGGVLVAGGYSDSGVALKSAQLFDPLTSTWTSVPDMSAGHADGFAVRLADGRVMVGAGVAASGAEAAVDIYDPISRRWEAASPLPVGCSYCAAGVLPSGNVIVAGGELTTGGVTTIFDTAYTYDPASRVWELFAPMTLPRSALGGAVTGGQFFVAGGWDGTALLDTGAVTATLSAPPTAVASIVGPAVVQGVPGSLTAVTVSAAGSTDPGGNPLTFTWTIGATIVVVTADPVRVATIGLPVGTHTLTLTAANQFGGASSASVTVTVEDATIALHMTIGQLEALVLQLQQHLAAAQLKAAAAEARATSAEQAIVNAVNAITAALRRLLHNPSFTIPGATPQAQLQWIVQTVIDMGAGKFKWHR